jgi:Circularly permutated YpsA SLOG family
MASNHHQRSKVASGIASIMPDLRTLVIVSGGQTGADRAALDFAIENDRPHDGWCPLGRLAEDGPIGPRYRLRETPRRRYTERTEWNVRDSDATVAFSIARDPIGGTALTLAIARRMGKPSLHLSRDEAAESAGDLDTAISSSARRLVDFLTSHSIRRLNVAGPRASQEIDVGSFVRGVLQAALEPPETSSSVPAD